MQYRMLGKTGYRVSEISFGAWAIGGTWGEVDDTQSTRALEEAVDQGVNFFDTADVYGDGRSERLMGALAASKKQRLYIATKAGRRLDPHVTAGYTLENITAFVERSLKNLKVDCIDLLQLHCPPTPVYDNAYLFDQLSSLIKDGKIAKLGVSVEKVSEARKAMEYDIVSTVQIIFNMFRHKPADAFFAQAKANNVGILARVPLASGLLTGKMSLATQFANDDHRLFNRKGEAFDKGETFSGVDYVLGLKAVEELRQLLPEGMTLSQMALKWILMFDAVTCAIPGAKTPEQVGLNAMSSDMEPLSPQLMAQIKEIYDAYIRKSVHDLW
jgi:aryl-alcohol dehydrogenase-like predicted oxidoreductase